MPWSGWKRSAGTVQLLLPAVPVAHDLEAPHDVEVLEPAAIVLAALDRRRMAAVIGEDDDIGRLVELRRGEPDRQRTIGGALQFGGGAFRRLASGVGQQALDRARLYPGLVGAAVDHHLRRVDVALLEGAGVDALPLGALLAGEAVLPADVVPVIDVEGQGDDVRPRCQLAEIQIGRRAGAAALRGEELDRPWTAFRLGRSAAAGQQARAGDQEGTSSDE